MSRNKAVLDGSSPGRKYLEFELDVSTLAIVEKLAAKAGVSPFAMCLTLVRESISAVELDKS